MSDHERMRNLIGPYVMGELTPQEEREMDDHLASCPECRSEVEELREIHDDLAELSSAPPPELRERILERASGEGNRERESRARRVPLAAAAAVVFVVVVAGALYTLLSGGDATRLSPTALAPGSGGEVSLSDDGGNVRVSLEVWGLPEPGEGEYYELWFVRDGERVSGGGFTVDSEGEAAVTMNAPDEVSEYPNVGITRERAGDPRPTPENNVLKGELRRG